MLHQLQRSTKLGEDVLRSKLTVHAAKNPLGYRTRLQAHGDVPVMDSLGVLFQHAAFFARIARTTGSGVSRRQLYTQPPKAMVDHVRRFAGQRELTNDFSGDR